MVSSTEDLSIIFIVNVIKFSQKKTQQLTNLATIILKILEMKNHVHRMLLEETLWHFCKMSKQSDDHLA